MIKIDRTPIDSLLRKAMTCADAGEAMKFAQAALNAANAISVIADFEIDILVAESDHADDAAGMN